MPARAGAAHYRKPRLSGGDGRQAQMIYDQIWFDYQHIVAVRPTPQYLPLALATRDVLEWDGTLHKADGEH